jgi:hypothetical protein
VRLNKIGTAMSKGDIHTVKHSDGWANRVEGNERVSNTAPTKADSQAKGREMAIKRASRLSTIRTTRSLSATPIRGYVIHAA